MFVNDRTESAGATGRPPATLADALDGVAAALDALAAVDTAREAGRDVLDAVVTVERLSARLAAVQLGLLGAVDRRDLYGLDGAVTLASWYREHTRLDPAEAARRAHAATRLPRFPLLASALAKGTVTAGHVVAVTEAAVPNRITAIAAAEPVLVELALHAQPRDVRTAVRAIADHTDPDGTQVAPLATCGPDPRRELHLRPTIDGLHHISGLLDQLHAEALLTALDALDTPDPANTPADQQRSPAQRRADALAALAHQALDRGTLPTVQGNRPHLLLTADLTHLLPGPLLTDPTHLSDLIAAHATDLLHARGDEPPPWLVPRPGRALGPPPDQLRSPGSDAVRLPPPGGASEAGGHGSGDGPRLRWTGPLPPHRAAHLALHAELTAVLTLGPYRVVNVGRTHRTLPAWLRTALEAIHRHCRGPDCDRPAAWTEAHHVDAYDHGADTDLNDTVPLCKAHHDLVTSKRWAMAFDPDSAACIWTSRDGTIRTTHPPPRHLVGVG